MILFFIFVVLIVLTIFCCPRGMLPGPVVVVGNGPSLIGKGLGPIIDSFPNIIRINKFITKGYEKDVGSRTTGWNVNENFDLKWIKNKIAKDRLKLNWMGSRKIHKLMWSFPWIEGYSFRTNVNGCKNFTAGTLAILHMIENGHSPVYIAGISGSSGAYYFDQSQKTIVRNKKNIKKSHCEPEEHFLLSKLLKSGKVIKLD